MHVSANHLCNKEYPFTYIHIPTQLIINTGLHTYEHSQSSLILACAHGSIDDHLRPLPKIPYYCREPVQTKVNQTLLHLHSVVYVLQPFEKRVVWGSLPTALLYKLGRVFVVACLASCYPLTHSLTHSLTH